MKLGKHRSCSSTTFWQILSDQDGAQSEADRHIWLSKHYTDAPDVLPSCFLPRECALQGGGLIAGALAVQASRGIEIHFVCDQIAVLTGFPDC